MSACDEVRARILAGEDASEHLESCASCREEAALVARVAEAVRALEPPLPPASVVAAEAERLERRLRPRARFGWRLPAMAAAAAFAVVVAVRLCPMERRPTAEAAPVVAAVLRNVDAVESWIDEDVEEDDESEWAGTLGLVEELVGRDAPATDSESELDGDWEGEGEGEPQMEEGP